MKSKTIITGILLTFVAVSALWLVIKEPTGAAAGKGDRTQAMAENQSEENAVVVYYFHNTQRCPTCLKIEELSHQAVTDGYANNLKDGSLVWKVVNVEEPENAHFAKDYNLISQSLVLVDNRPGHEGHWRNLDQIWELVWQEDAFLDYVNGEIASFLGES